MLVRGFKSEAERIAKAARKLVGVSEYAPLPARKLAAAMNVFVAGPENIPGLPSNILSQLLVEHPRTWSGVTFSVNGKPFVIFNPTHAPERQESDLMHELAHIWRKHKPGRLEPIGRFPFATRSFDKDQEEEATWLGGCLQIPRDSLLHLTQRRYDISQIAVHFGASKEMVRFRINMSGVKRQIERLGAYRSR